MITIIAEAGVNHCGNMTIAREMILRAKESGADIFKTQLYDPVKLFPDREVWSQGKNWFDEILKTQLSKEQVFTMAEWCKEAEIEFFGSAFDLERLGWLEEVGVKRHKIASRFHRQELLDFITKTGKPIIVSLPYGNPSKLLFPFKRTDFLYCIPEYPAPLNKLHLQKINFTSLDGFSGLSDHSIGTEASMVAIIRGARIIERHFCLKRDNSNPDMICSSEPEELAQLVKFSRKVGEILC